MQVKVLTDFIHEGDTFIKGDSRTVSDPLGDYFCRAGWVEDISGTVKTATPNTNDVVLLVDNSNKVNPVSEVV